MESVFCCDVQSLAAKKILSAIKLADVKGYILDFSSD
jgi:hypothetical protein